MTTHRLIALPLALLAGLILLTPAAAQVRGDDPPPAGELLPPLPETESQPPAVRRPSAPPSYDYAPPRPSYAPAGKVYYPKARYRSHFFLTKDFRHAGKAYTTMKVSDPWCGCCTAAVKVCVPACCVGHAPAVSKNKLPLLGLACVRYHWPCGYRVKLVAGIKGHSKHVGSTIRDVPR